MKRYRFVYSPQTEHCAAYYLMEEDEQGEYVRHEEVTDIIERNDLKKVSVRLHWPEVGAPFNTHDCEVIDVSYSDRIIKVQCEAARNLPAQAWFVETSGPETITGIGLYTTRSAAEAALHAWVAQENANTAKLNAGSDRELAIGYWTRDEPVEEYVYPSYSNEEDMERAYMGLVEITGAVPNDRIAELEAALVRIRDHFDVESGGPEAWKDLALEMAQVATDALSVVSTRESDRSGNPAAR